MITSLLLIAAAPAVAPATAPAQPDKVVCKMETQANSRIPNRVCLLQSEWTRMEEENGDDSTSSRQQRSTGRQGTIVNDAEGFVSGYSPPGRTVPGISTRPH